MKPNDFRSASMKILSNTCYFIKNSLVNDNSESFKAVAQGFATQGSSASTFGIPTTPKTTPFMTPTPLSPSHLSPINSEPNLAFMMENESAV